MIKPDRNIQSPFPGRIFFYEELESTMTQARALVASGDAGQGTIVQAGTQSAGRGRIPGRKWESGQGQNLLFTILIERKSLKIPISVFPLAAGLAVSLALEELRIPCSIKWPNDILCGEKKICGILCETAGSFLSAGIGLNCNQERFPGGLKRPPTSIFMETGRESPPSILLETLLPHLHSVLTMENWHAEIERRLYGMGRMAILSEGAADSGGEKRVRISGIGGQGELMVEGADGARSAVFTGEILYDQS
ncbi:MAG: biotin--[acetyl-CoA-carboxylase] ligase [Spirochaetales bacterium]|nr:biotin--[acetyl-CoA-carboxylase] ligase [Spirochaetales bacterium]